MPEETLNKLYEIVISSVGLYEEALIANGFDYFAIKELLDNGIIKYGTETINL